MILPTVTDRLATADHEAGPLKHAAIERIPFFRRLLAGEARHVVLCNLLLTLVDGQGCPELPHTSCLSLGLVSK
jgi:hypothetical protein